MVQPLVVTLELEAAAQQRFDADRARCATASGAAHLIVFHALPAEIEEQVRVDLVHVAGPPFPIAVAGVLPLTNGAAYAIVSPELTRRRTELVDRWWGDLTERDRAAYRPHVTVVSGVEPAAARAEFNVLRRGFRRYQARAEGFILWRAGEPLTELARIPFADLPAG